ncbi:MAG: ribosome recycling factor [candidate division Zixibacteria bacterium]|nr:ribosome recycling factor [candidate division Zixibacteria bacterium]
MVKQILSDTEDKMKKSLLAVNRDFGSLRTGKASPALLDAIRVDYHGTVMPLNQLATVSAPEARLMVVQAWDKAIVGEISKAIQKADLGLNPQVDGNIIRLPIPPLNEDRRRELVKHCKKIAEDGKIAIRNIRRDANDSLKNAEKDKSISEDDMKRATEKVQGLTNKYTDEIDLAMEAKETAIMEV